MGMIDPQPQTENVFVVRTTATEPCSHRSIGLGVFRASAKLEVSLCTLAGSSPNAKRRAEGPGITGKR